MGLDKSEERRVKVAGTNIVREVDWMGRLFRKCIVWYLVMAMFVIGITPRVYAGFSPSEVISLSSTERSADLKKVRKFLEMKMVGERLQELGLAPEEIQSRLLQLSDQQIHRLALKVDDLTVAGDSGLGIIVGLLVIAILIVILVYLLQHRIVIK
jgi:hypothetical protein